MSRHLEVEEAVTALRLLRTGATLTDHQTTPAKVLQDPPNHINSQSQTSPVIINETIYRIPLFSLVRNGREGEC